MSEKSGVSSQAITLPTGGGAVQAIGETFSPDLFTGTGNFTVPLALPTGRRGFVPQLSLTYSTGNGNGPFGLGWTLSVPEVSRKTSKGIPRYLDHDADPAHRDTFVLSGSEDLVQVSAEVAGRSVFRPRTEGLFARIERVVAGDDDYWRVSTKDGLVSVYGTPGRAGDDPAVVSDPTQPSKVFRWRLTLTQDPFGNRIEYTYLRDRGTDGPHNYDQSYLQHVRYVDHEDAGETRFLVSVDLDHAPRPDVFSDARAGFEVRTRLRCTRITTRTDDGVSHLVRTVDLAYVDERIAQGELPPDRLPSNGISLLSQVRVAGHDGDSTESLPPLEFAYTRFAPEQRHYQPITAVGGSMPPRSLASADLDTVSVFANGLPDIVQMDGSVRFWRNLGNGLFDAPQDMAEVPAGVHLHDAGVHFADMDGNGRADLLVLEQGGYFPLGFHGRWSEEGFVRYQQTPQVSFGDTELRLVDLDGDGVVDALHTAPGAFELYFNHPPTGWDETRQVQRRPLDEFPDVSFSDPRVKLADLNGDRLQDIALVEARQVSYWPYLGHGQWGRRVSAPLPGADTVFAAGFEPSRLQFGDLDGDGLDDLAYFEADQVTFWINQSGNGWSAPQVITGTPGLTDVSAVRLADVLGTGMAGPLWTSDAVTPTDENYRFLDLTGGMKPYLLTEMDNHRGAVTRLQYVASTRFYLEDVADPATRWKTLLPFPVHVLERVERLDAISGSKSTTQYVYHHGYWDGADRELRGFGRVEQLDSETFEDFHGSGLHQDADFTAVPAAMFSPPLLTRTWFHPGPVGDEYALRTEADFTPEFFADDPTCLTPPVARDQLLQSLPASQRGQALRSLRGQVLRTEIFALDGTPLQSRPYTVTERQYGIRELDPPVAGDARARVFFPHLVAERVSQWERGHEPMTRFTFTDDHDAYGQPRRALAVAVPRGRRPQDPAAADDPYLGLLTTTTYAQRDDPERFLVDRVAVTRTSQVIDDGTSGVFGLYDRVSAGDVDLWTVACTSSHYDGNAFEGLSAGRLGDFGALVRTQALVLTEDVLAAAYADPDGASGPHVPQYLDVAAAGALPGEYPPEFASLLPGLAGYRFADGSTGVPAGWYAQTTRTEYDLHRSDLPARGLPVTEREAMGHDTHIDYDRFHLLPMRLTDAVGLTVEAVNDYRVLLPAKITDENRNCRTVTFTPLGFVATSCAAGPDGTAEGDTAQVPGAQFVYDHLAFVERGMPVGVRTLRREFHTTQTDVAATQRDATIETAEYSDGFGRLVQTRRQAEDVRFGDDQFGGGVLTSDQADGAATAADTVGSARPASGPVNVVVSGAQVYDNKGRVVRQYEPFYAEGLDYETPALAHGQATTTVYDPRGQVVRTVNPDGSERRTILGVPTDLTRPDTFTPTPFEVYAYDPNDLAPVCLATDGSPLADRAPQAHHFTPSSTVLDALGRTVTTVVRAGTTLTDEISTRSSYDIQGNLVSVTDGLGRVAIRHVHDLAGHALRTEGIDSGVSRVVLDAAGSELERRDSRGALVLQAYDLLHRPVRLWARNAAGSPVTMRQRLEYGDGGTAEQDDAQRQARRDLNLLRRLHRHHDEAGLLVVAAVDFKGNVVERTRQVISDAVLLTTLGTSPGGTGQFTVDWTPAPQQTLAELETALLEPTVHRTTTGYDALGRLRFEQLPQDVEGRRREVVPYYNRAGVLERVFLDGDPLVERIAYNAKGQRALIGYGNGILTRYSYDPHTFRLRRIRTEHCSRPDPITYRPAGSVLQDTGYEHDLAGNVTAVHERSPGCGVLGNAGGPGIDPDLAKLLVAGEALDSTYAYDPLYRLVSATGRETDAPTADNPYDTRPRSTDLTRARGYKETYSYDRAGNLLQLRHRAPSGAFTRDYSVDPSSNRVLRLDSGGIALVHTYDVAGNLGSETTSRHFTFDHADRLTGFRIQAAGSEPSLQAHYLYDATGQRVKKLVRAQGGQVETTDYIGDLFEHHRVRGGTTDLEQNRVHVMDDRQRIAVVRVGIPAPDDATPAVQVHLGDHLGSSTVVVDGTGNLVNREEYTPFGETSFGSFARKRYRYAGKERDEESGLAYHSARYLAPWLGRWISTDPIGTNDGLNLYAYVSNNPLRFSDPEGTDKGDADTTDTAKVTGAGDSSERGSSQVQHDITYLSQSGSLFYLGAQNTGWLPDPDRRLGKEPAVPEASAVYGQGEADAPTMRDGIGQLNVSLHVNDVRGVLSGAVVDGQRQPGADLEVPLRWTQQSGEQPIRLQPLPKGFGNGGLQVSARYLPSHTAVPGVSTHSVMLDITYSSDRTSREDKAEETGKLSVEPDELPVKAEVSSKASLSQKHTEFPHRWTVEVRWISYNTPAPAPRPMPASSARKP